MNQTRNTRGFSLVELLLVLAILGIISAIAIPSFLGQRRRARVIGDAKANAAVLRMMLESRRADTGTFGTPGSLYSWTKTTAPDLAQSPAPNFTATQGTTAMTYAVQMNSSGLAYTLTVKDPSLANANVYITNQNGSNVYTLQ